MKPLVPDVFIWTWFSERHGYDFNGYLVRHPSGNLCIDPVETSEDVLEEIVREGIDRIILTNRNHGRASGKFRERTGAPVVMHAADAAHARGQGSVVDGDLRVGEQIGPFVVLDASGKSPGEVALHWPERRILLVGDACVGNPPGQCSLLPAKVLDDPQQLQENLRRIVNQIDFDVLLPGDGAPILSNAREALQTLVRSFG